MNESYTLHVAGLVRELKKVRIAPDLRIASFVMLGDTRLIEKCADALYEKIKGLGDINMLVCPEAKGIPCLLYTSPAISRVKQATQNPIFPGFPNFTSSAAMTPRMSPAIAGPFFDIRKRSKIFTSCWL